jgi:hypothetical protein
MKIALVTPLQVVVVKLQELLARSVIDYVIIPLKMMLLGNGHKVCV